MSSSDYTVFRINSMNLDLYIDKVVEIAMGAIDTIYGYSEVQKAALRKVNVKNQFINDINGGHEVIVIGDGENIVGVLQYKNFPKFVRVVKIFVSEAFQGRGYGSRLISKVKDLNKPIVLESAVSKQAVGFYKKNGFREVRRDLKFIDGVRLNIIVMSYKPSDTVRVRVRDVKDGYIIAIGDVLLNSTEAPPFEEDSWVKLEEAEGFLRDGINKGILHPLAEYPFYHLEKV